MQENTKKYEELLCARFVNMKQRAGVAKGFLNALMKQGRRFLTILGKTLAYRLSFGRMGLAHVRAPKNVTEFLETLFRSWRPKMYQLHFSGGYAIYGG